MCRPDDDQELTVEAALTGNCAHVFQAAMLDPEQICALADELLEAHGGMVPELA